MKCDKAETFQSMHRDNDTFIFPKCSDAVSATVLEWAGFEEIGTASAAMSWLYGVADGENTYAT